MQDRNERGWPPSDEDGQSSRSGGDPSYEDDIKDAKRTLERVRRERPYHRALWGFRLYYIGVLSSMGSLLVSCFGNSDAPMVVVPIALPLGVAGYIFGYLQLRVELRDYMAATTSKVWHARRDRKNLWQAAIFRDAFMGRVDPQ